MQGYHSEESYVITVESAKLGLQSRCIERKQQQQQQQQEEEEELKWSHEPSSRRGAKRKRGHSQGVVDQKDKTNDEGDDGDDERGRGKTQKEKRAKTEAGLQ